MNELIDSTESSQQPFFLSSSSSQYTFLYIEDNPTNMLLLRMILKPYESIRVIGADTAEEGLEIMRDESVDVVLMDLDLPGMHGFDALALILADEDLHEIPVIAVTDSVQPREISNGLKAGFFDYITKPVRIPMLMAALERACSQGMDHSFSSDAALALRASY